VNVPDEVKVWMVYAPEVVIVPPEGKTTTLLLTAGVEVVPSELVTVIPTLVPPDRL
jgi:hypothetical protein